MTIAIILIVFILLLVLIQYNKLVKLKMNVSQSKSGVDVYLQQRFDLIPNLIQVVKSYMNYEKEIIENITKLRVKYNETKDIKVSEELNNKIDKIVVIAESYPELKASEQFFNIQKNLSKIESQLQAARRIYNIDVTKYNTKINTVPYNIVALMFGFKEEYLFHVDKEEISL